MRAETGRIAWFAFSNIQAELTHSPITKRQTGIPFGIPVRNKLVFNFYWIREIKTSNGIIPKSISVTGNDTFVRFCFLGSN